MPGHVVFDDLGEGREGVGQHPAEGRHRVRREEPVPARALDLDSRDRVFRILRERALQGALILIVTHDRELAELCDGILDLDA